MSSDSVILLVGIPGEPGSSLKAILRDAGMTVAEAAGRRHALHRLTALPVSVILCPPQFGDGNWKDILSSLAPLPEPPPVIVVGDGTDHTFQDEVRALGGCGTLAAPFSAGDVLSAIEAARRRSFKVYAAGSVRPEVVSEWQCVPQSSASPPAVLVVDDDSMVRSLLEKILVREGYAVVTAADGSDGIRQFRENPDVDLVVLDWKMPGIPGDEVLRAMRRIRPGAKVIVSSGCEPAEVARVFAGDGTIEFIPKPFAPRLFAEKVRAILET